MAPCAAHEFFSVRPVLPGATSSSHPHPHPHPHVSPSSHELAAARAAPEFDAPWPRASATIGHEAPVALADDEPAVAIRVRRQQRMRSAAPHLGRPCAVGVRHLEHECRRGPPAAQRRLAAQRQVRQQPACPIRALPRRAPGTADPAQTAPPSRRAASCTRARLPAAHANGWRRRAQPGVARSRGCDAGSANGRMRLKSALPGVQNRSK